MVDSSDRLHSVNNNVAVIGGGDGGVVRECLQRGYGHIDWYELDPEVVNVCEKHLSKIGIKESKSVTRIWGDAFESIKKIKDRKYDKIFVDLNDDDECINLAIRNMKNLKRILKLDGVITTQVGSQDRASKLGINLATFPTFSKCL
jgi:spermidine synthase